MMEHISLLRVLVLFVFFGSIICYEYPCTYTSSRGDFYDLSPLSYCDNTGDSVDSGSFIINVCNSVKSCPTHNAAICQDGQYSTGNAEMYSFSDYSGGKGVTLTYLGGDNTQCPNNKNRTSVLNFICDPDTTMPNYTFVKEDPTCTYNFDVVTGAACPITKAPQVQICPTYVYLVPHTHDDVGWLETIDGYYESQVKHILDTVVASLIANPERKFIYVEQAYFWRWWTDANTTNTQRENLHKLYSNGQFEFVIGGWVMQDEACTTFGADIDQMTLGHQFLLDTFGAIPTKGWQIDPFGPSSVTPTLNKLSGFDAHLIDRVTEKPLYVMSKRMQFNWQGSPSLGQASEIFTQIMDGGGAAEAGYCDWLSSFGFGNDPVNPSNVAHYASQFYAMAQSRSEMYLSNVLLAAWGCDFAFQNATPMFHSMDTLINYMQSIQDQTHIYVKYATLSEYFAAVKAVPNIVYPSNYGNDFFPLDAIYYWTGYYTSRTQLKGLVRQGEGVAHAAEQIYTLSKIIAPSVSGGASFANLTLLRQANADAQHHDGVTGTSEPNVVMMYEDDLINGMNAALLASSLTLSSYVTGGQNVKFLSPSAPSLLSTKPSETIAVVVYNSLGWVRNNEFVVLPVNGQNYQVTSANGNVIPSQVSVDYSLNAVGKYNLFFQASVPQFGYTTFYVTDTSSTSDTTFVDSYELKLGADAEFSNGVLNITISGTTGRLSNVTNTASGVSIEVDQNILEYVSMNSGAYAFGPKGPATAVSTQPPTSVVTTGPLVTEIFQTFNTGGGSYAKQIIRLYHSNDKNVAGFVEFKFEIGVLPSHIEVVTAFSSSIQNQQLFYTDDNGFEFLERQYEFSVAIEGNYYPTIYASFIQDQNAQLSIISERSHGVSSQNEGEIELMIHRNPDMSDNLGPGLTDTTIVFPVIRAIVDTPKNSPIQYRLQPYLLNFPLHVFSAPTNGSLPMSNHSFISAALPPNVHFLSLYSFDASSNRTVIFRLTHMFAVNEDPVYSQPASVDVKQLFSSLSIKSFVETTLTANKVLVNPAPTTVQLTPKQIRTFIITFN